MGRRLHLEPPNDRQPPQKTEKRRLGGHPSKINRRRRKSAGTRPPTPERNEPALDDTAEGAQATGSRGSQGLRPRLTACGQRERPTGGTNTAKGVAEGSDWRARNEPPEPTIEA